MKQLFILLATLALVSCGSGQNRSQKQQDEAAPEAFTPVKLPSDCHGVAYTFFKKLWEEDGETYEVPCPEKSTLEYSNEFDEQEGFFAEQTMYCYPLKDGGWLGVFKTVDAAEGSAGFYSFTTYTWKDDKIQPVEGILPVPELDDLLSSEAVGDNPEAYERLKKVYAGQPEDYLLYFFDPNDQSLQVELHPVDLETAESKHCWEEVFWDLSLIIEACPTYRWTGEMFVK